MYRSFAIIRRSLYLFLRIFGQSSRPRNRFFSSIFRAFGASSIQEGFIFEGVL